MFNKKLLGMVLALGLVGTLSQADAKSNKQSGKKAAAEYMKASKSKKKQHSVAKKHSQKRQVASATKSKKVAAKKHKKAKHHR
jgi:hypothetical protein